MGRPPRERCLQGLIPARSHRRWRYLNDAASTDSVCSCHARPVTIYSSRCVWTLSSRVRAFGVVYRSGTFANSRRPGKPARYRRAWARSSRPRKSRTIRSTTAGTSTAGSMCMHRHVILSASFSSFKNRSLALTRRQVRVANLCTGHASTWIYPPSSARRGTTTATDRVGKIRVLP